MICCKNNSGSVLIKKIIHSPKAPVAAGPYSQAVLLHNTLYVSGQIPLNPLKGELVTGAFQNQVQQVMRNLQHVLNEAGMDFTDVLRTTVYLTKIKHYNIFNDVYSTYFTDHYPARSLVEVAALPGKAAVMIDLIASKEN
ncbi:MAG TPA: RidA family protein [Spirochaetota bacterium]|nr:RidA family protein [Spirochaetota bacterium]